MFLLGKKLNYIYILPEAFDKEYKQAKEVINPPCPPTIKVIRTSDCETDTYITILYLNFYPRLIFCNKAGVF